MLISEQRSWSWLDIILHTLSLHLKSLCQLESFLPPNRLQNKHQCWNKVIGVKFHCWNSENDGTFITDGANDLFGRDKIDNFHHQRETSASKIQGRFLNLLCFWGVSLKNYRFCSTTNSTLFHAKRNIDRKVESRQRDVLKTRQPSAFQAFTNRWDARGR